MSKYKKHKGLEETVSQDPISTQDLISAQEAVYRLNVPEKRAFIIKDVYGREVHSIEEWKSIIYKK